jgi:hypothetical protein
MSGGVNDVAGLTEKSPRARSEFVLIHASG